MRFSTSAAFLLGFAPVVLGQNETFLTGLVNLLTSSGYTRLANITSQVNTTAAGPSVLAQLSSGSPFVLFAPSDSAFGLAPSNITSDPDVLTDIYAYHIVSGNFTGDATTYPNVTLGRSLLSDPSVVKLETTGEHQVVAWATRGDGKVHVLNQLNDSTVTNTTTYGNVTINFVDHVLGIPASFADTVPVNNASLSSAQAALSTVSVPYYNSTTNSTTNDTFFDVLNTGLHGFTFFAPNDTAIQAATASLASLASNQTALIALFQNHLINGSTVYSPLLTAQNYTSAAGEPLTFVLNATGHYVTSGNVTAEIVQPDVLLPNGVIHVIDRVLTNTQSDSAAASSAASSASSAATHTQSATGAIGLSATATSSSSGGSASNTSNAGVGAAQALPNATVVFSLFAVLCGVLVGSFVGVST